MIDYTELRARLLGMSPDDAVACCRAELPGLWIAEYRTWTTDSNIHQIDIGSHTFLLDFTSEWATAQNDDQDPVCQEDRVVVAYGRSTTPAIHRDGGRMQGYLGPTGEIFGDGYDKGHFIAHSMGGDDLDTINWFAQERRLNRGWSAEGKLYRSLEEYCSRVPGTFFFSRPIYRDLSSRPIFLEVGLLRENAMEVHLFDNRLRTPPLE